MGKRQITVKRAGLKRQTPAEEFKPSKFPKEGGSSDNEVTAFSPPSSLSGDLSDGDFASEEVVNKEASTSNQLTEIAIEANSVAEASSTTSSFHVHLGYKLSEGDIEDLLRKKWEYKWECPAFDTPNYKWIGTRTCFLKDVNTKSSCGLKQSLYKQWLDVYSTSGGNDFDSSKQRFFFSLFNSYRDILHCNKRPFYLKGFEEDSSAMNGYIIHSLNHIFRTRDLVIKNDTKLAKNGEIANTDDGLLDQGFTRPKVLILLPYRSIALRVVTRLIQLTPQVNKAKVEYMERFVDEFGTEDEDDIDNDDLTQLKLQKSSKPADHQALFRGNQDDAFVVGIKFTRRSIKLFNDFHSSDMIVASPLGLRTNIDKASTNKEKDVDYLSSIEVVIVDHSDIIAMQNWDNLSAVLDCLNHLPSKQHGTDIMRIRKWYLDGHSKFYRQTIILGYYANPDISASFNQQCLNYKGKVKSTREYKGVLSKVLPQVRQIYERFNASSIVDADDARLDYFIKKVFPKIKDTTEGGILLFISSYFEYVRLRNFFREQSASFCSVADYTEQSDISRARLWFFDGKRKIMLYTERRHFTSRYKIRGVRNLIIYSLPDRKDFYPEIVNMLEGSSEMTCSVLFSRFDQFRLERIVGTASAKRMVSSEKNVFVFC